MARIGLTVLLVLDLASDVYLGLVGCRARPWCGSASGILSVVILRHRLDRAIAALLRVPTLTDLPSRRPMLLHFEHGRLPSDAGAGMVARRAGRRDTGARRVRAPRAVSR